MPADNGAYFITLKLVLPGESDARYVDLVDLLPELRAGVGFNATMDLIVYGIVAAGDGVLAYLEGLLGVELVHGQTYTLDRDKFSELVTDVRAAYGAEDHFFPADNDEKLDRDRNLRELRVAFDRIDEHINQPGGLAYSVELYVSHRKDRA